MKGTGRTTRMLQDAIDKMLAGQHVVVLTGPFPHVKTLMDSAFALLTKEQRRGVARERQKAYVIRKGTGSIEFRSINSLATDEAAELRRHGETAEVLADHFAVESRFARLLEMLHRFDQKGTP